MAGWFGGLDVDEMKESQERAYQYGKACKRGDTLDSCEKFIKYFKESTNLLTKHKDELYKGVNEGNSDSEQIMHNAKRLTDLAETL